MKIGTIVIGFSLLSASYNIYTFSDDWVWLSFIKGLMIGLPIVTVWWRNKTIGLLLGALAAFALLFTGFGHLENMERDRIFFSGASLGFMLGFIPAYHLNKPNSYLLVSGLMQMDGYTKLALKFREKYKNSTKS